MARGTASRIAERKTGVPKQAFAEQDFERVLQPWLRDRRHRLFGGGMPLQRQHLGRQERSDCKDGHKDAGRATE